MSLENAFLECIAADRTDRTRLLVFADWLAERSDPREEFVRLHARLLDMDGTEAEFENLDRKWSEWTGGVSLIPGYLPGPLSSSRLPDRWLDALCRVFTAADVVAHPFDEKALTEVPDLERQEFGQMDHTNISGEESLTLYRGPVTSFRSPLDFVAQTVLRDLWDNPFRPRSPRPDTIGFLLPPVSRGGFWQRWRLHCANLRNPPPIPVIAPDNRFIGGQYIEGDWNNWAFVAAHRHDYFALFWSTTA
jgi:uncharacterized protein (TIGR02996 family)